MFSEAISQKNGKVLADFNKELNLVSTKIIETNKPMFDLFLNIIDSNLEVISLNFIILNYKHSVYQETILSICFKNLITLMSAMRLMEQGLLGSAKILFRNVYENLLIGKMLGVTKSSFLYNEWIKGNQISLRKEVFQKLEKKASEESMELWDLLNKYTHATIYSQDFMLEIDKPEIANCNSIITTLLVMNYHLVNRFVLNYYNYYLDYYFNPYFNTLKKEIKQKNKLATDLIDTRCKKVIREFESKWIIIENL